MTIGVGLWSEAEISEYLRMGGGGSGGMTIGEELWSEAPSSRISGPLEISEYLRMGCEGRDASLESLYRASNCSARTDFIVASDGALVNLADV